MAIPAQKPSIDQCNACGKLFPRTAIRLCGQCSLVEEHRFQLVRDFLYANDGAGMGEIARATGVSGSDVRKFMDGGRLIDVTSGLDHCTCGGVGERCRTCRAKLSSSFRDMEATMRSEHDASFAPRDEDSARATYVRRIRRLGDAS